ncbi:hypothetical protein LTS17_002466 [Exophiala oligosperma]
MTSPLKFRRGTKSCYECRRRKIKCVFTENHRKCKECHSRGAPCVEQDKASVPSTRAEKSTIVQANSSTYSLRERVARVEDFIETFLRKQNSEVSYENSSDVGNQRTSTAEATVPGTLIGEQTGSATTKGAEDSAVLSLFNNSVIAQVDQQQSSVQTEASSLTQTSSTFDPTRYELLNLLPHEPDLNTLINLSQDWWLCAPHRFPEFFDDTVPVNIRSELSRKLSLPDPTETVKVLLWTTISAERLSQDTFRNDTFVVPTAIAALSNQTLPAIERIVLQNDEVARTLPGLECLLLLSRYYCNVGKLRKSWHICRRALEYAISEGLHRGSKLTKATNSTSQGPDLRHVRIWQRICFKDRYISMILGLPYGIPSSYLWKPDLHALTNDERHGAQFYSFMASMISLVVDRNQHSPSEDGFLTTLKIDQELESHIKDIDTQWWDSSLESLILYTREVNLERFEAQTLKHFMRALLHLPFMLKSTGPGLYQYSYDTTVGSSLRALAAYKVLRVDLALDPYLCTTFDFQAFIMSVLLTLHLITQNQEEGSNPPSEDDAAWEAVRKTTEILQQASQDLRDINTVSKQAVPVLQMLMRASRPDDSSGPCPYGFDTGMSCKVTIPCFGEIKIAPGKRGPRCLGDCTGTRTSTVGFNGSPVNMAPPATSRVADVSPTAVPTTTGPPAGPATPGDFDTMTMSLDHVVAFPNVAWGNGVVDYTSTDTDPPQGDMMSDAWMWAGNGLGVGSDLQQEWGLDFFGP